MLINQNFPDGCIIRTGKAGNNAGHYVFYHPELGVISGTKDLNNFKSLKQFYKERYNSGMKIDIACFDTILNDYKKLKNLYGE